MQGKLHQQTASRPEQERSAWSSTQFRSWHIQQTACVDGENDQKTSFTAAPNTDITRTNRHRIHTYQHLYTEEKHTMATLDTLKRTLREKAVDTAPSPPSSTQKLSDSQYKAGFDILT
jgi:hypothetical protein